MPFTFAHPSVVLIIRKIFPPGYFSLTALIVGSIAPDFEGFLLMQTNKPLSHTWPGMFFFDLPVALLICFLWHNVIRDSFIDYSPLFLKKRMYVFRKFEWNHYFKSHPAIVIISLLTGIYTHLLWDSYTHSNGTDYTAITVFNHEMSIFIFWQYLSSLLGGIVVLIFIIGMPSSEEVPQNNNKGYWFITTEIACIVILLRSIAFKERFLSVSDRFATMGVTVISAFMAGILCASLVNIYFRRRRIT